MNTKSEESPFGTCNPVIQGADILAPPCWLGRLLPYTGRVGFESRVRKHSFLKYPMQMRFASLEDKKVPKHLQQVLFPKKLLATD